MQYLCTGIGSTALFSMSMYLCLLIVITPWCHLNKLCPWHSFVCYRCCDFLIVDVALGIFLTSRPQSGLAASVCLRRTQFPLHSTSTKAERTRGESYGEDAPCHCIDNAAWRRVWGVALYGARLYLVLVWHLGETHTHGFSVCCFNELSRRTQTLFPPTTSSVSRLWMRVWDLNVCFQTFSSFLMIKCKRAAGQLRCWSYIT